MKVGIFKTPEGYEKRIIAACKDMNICYEVVDLFCDEWYIQFKSANCDGYILRPPTNTSVWKNIYFKRLFLIKDQIENRCVPSFESILYYESKISMADFYSVNNIPHVKSYSFFNFKDAWSFAKKTSLPKIVKSDGGSQGIGVKIIKNRYSLKLQILRSFFTKNIFRGLHKFKNIKVFFKSISRPIRIFFRSKFQYYQAPDINQGYIHIQEAIDVKSEWRIIKIGDSYFGHQKLEGKNGLHSGSKKKMWGEPPIKLLDFARETSIKLGINSMCFDIFESKGGEYLVNEMQVCFGISTANQMYINGLPGRYIYINEIWEFEEGEYCSFGCDKLRINTLRKVITNS